MGGDAYDILPRLRQDLELIDGGANPHGAMRLTIYDPLRHRFFSLEEEHVALLSLWRPISQEQFCAEACVTLGYDDARDVVADLVYFLQANSLTEQPEGHDPSRLVEQATASKRGVLQSLTHSYLFVRIPLVRPHAFLTRTLPLVTPFFSRSVWIIVVALGVLGLYLVSRQWETFSRTFLDFLSLEGIVVYVLAIVLIKMLHELGHAYTAARYGVRVTTMGVAFMVMMPLLYTDVTNAWRLRSARARFRIDAAGIAVELGLACLATCLWAFLPDGPARSVAFVTATTSWVLSLAVNLNPFMKFDGYYLLVDGVDLPNLQNRAFAYARWWFRELLFDLGFSPPENFDTRTARWLVIYAWCVWIYRLFLFLGIALLVYALFFKLLGVILFAIEIAWFVVLPILKELHHWWKLRMKIMQRRRGFLSAAIVGAVLVCLLVPVRWAVVLPAVLESETDFPVHAPRAARVAMWSIEPGRRVNAGDVLAVLSSQELEHDFEKVRISLSLLDMRLGRLAGDSSDLAARTSLMHERAARLEERDGLLRQISELKVRAPVSGVLTDTDSDIHVGSWVKQEDQLARLVRRNVVRGRAYANEDVLWRVSSGQTGLFVPDDAQMDTVTVVLRDIAQAGSDALAITYLASVYGGPVASERGEDGRITPRRSQYVLRFSTADGEPRRVVRGVVRLPGRSQSIAAMVWRRVAQVLIRETGF